MMIIKHKGTLSSEAKEKVREDIKRQLKDGFIVHDDHVEITFIDNEDVEYYNEISDYNVCMDGKPITSECRHECSQRE